MAPARSGGSPAVRRVRRPRPGRRQRPTSAGPPATGDSSVAGGPRCPGRLLVDVCPGTLAVDRPVDIPSCAVLLPSGDLGAIPCGVPRDLLTIWRGDPPAGAMRRSGPVRGGRDGPPARRRFGRGLPWAISRPATEIRAEFVLRPSAAAMSIARGPPGVRPMLAGGRHRRGGRQGQGRGRDEMGRPPDRVPVGCRRGGSSGPRAARATEIDGPPAGDSDVPPS